MQRYYMIQGFVLAFFSKSFYKDVAFNWGGKSYLYLLFLLAVCWIPPTIKMQQLVNVGIQEFSKEDISQFPVVKIAGGVVSTPEHRPYIIKLRNSKEIFAVIDTTGKFKNLQDAKSELLLTKNQLLRKDGNTTKITQISSKLDFIADPLVIKNNLQKYANFIWILAFTICLLFSYLYRIIQSILFSLLALLFNSIWRVNLSYSQLLQVVLVALTPSIVVATILNSFAIYYSYQLLSYFVISVVYILFGILANKSARNEII